MEVFNFDKFIHGSTTVQDIGGITSPGKLLRSPTGLRSPQVRKDAKAKTDSFFGKWTTKVFIYGLYLSFLIINFNYLA